MSFYYNIEFLFLLHFLFRIPFISDDNKIIIIIAAQTHSHQCIVWWERMRCSETSSSSKWQFGFIVLSLSICSALSYKRCTKFWITNKLLRTVLLSLCRISSSQMDMNLDTIRKHMMSISYALLLCKYSNENRIIIKLFVSVSQRCNLYLNFSGFREAIKNKADRNYDPVLSGTNDHHHISNIFTCSQKQ